MPTSPFSRDELRARRMLVVGDILLDQYTWGRAERVSPEAPVLVLKRQKTEFRLGGAASVARLASGLGVRVALAGVVGNDNQAAKVRQLLREAHVESGLVRCDASRPTSVKHRFLGQSERDAAHQILRVDDERREPLSSEMETALAQAINTAAPRCQAILVSDYAKGVCTPAIIESVMASAHKNDLPVIVDPARGVDPEHYRGATMLTPNRTEASLAVGWDVKTIEDGLKAAVEIRERAAVRSVLVTLDRDGMACSPLTGPAFHVSTKQRDVCDVTGAGDTVLAMVGIGQSLGASLRDTIALANAAAGIQVERLGVAPITWPEIHADLKARQRGSPDASAGKLTTEEEMAALAVEYRAAGQRVVLANGCFDLLHVGHVAHLEAAKELGEALVVAINSDASVRRLKGPTRPVISQQHRAAMLCSLSCVDHVFIFDADTPHALLRKIRPDVLSKGNSSFIEKIVGRQCIESYGGQVKAAGRVDGVSTTRIVERLNNRAGADACRAKRCKAQCNAISPGENNTK